MLMLVDMRRLLCVSVIVMSGCVFFVDDDDGEVCRLGAAAHADGAPLPQRDPATLQCETYGGGGCDPACGPCPLLAPEVTWGVCGSPCEALGESQCAADPACRVVKDANCAITFDCITDYVGCFPVDTAADDTVDCFTTDAWTCSRSSACTAMHTHEVCIDGPCDRPFELCVPEGTYPGTCWETVTCDAVTPSCPPGRTPGVETGCYTGACIPLDICEPM